MKQFDPDTVVSAAVLATMFGMSRVQIHNKLEPEGSVTRVGKGYHLVKSVNGYISKLRSRTTAKVTSTSPLQETKVRAIELRIAQTRRELMDMNEVLSARDEFLGTQRADLDGLPAAFTRDLDERR